MKATKHPYYWINRRPMTRQPLPEKCSKGHDYVNAPTRQGHRRCAQCKKEHDRERSLVNWEKRRNA